jgi:hypothetical protein
LCPAGSRRTLSGTLSALDQQLEAIRTDPSFLSALGECARGEAIPTSVVDAVGAATIAWYLLRNNVPVSNHASATCTCTMRSSMRCKSLRISQGDRVPLARCECTALWGPAYSHPTAGHTRGGCTLKKATIIVSVLTKVKAPTTALLSCAAARAMRRTSGQRRMRCAMSRVVVILFVYIHIIAEYKNGLVWFG